MKPSIPKRAFRVAGLAVLLHACGGGDEGGDSPPPSPPPPAARFTLSGTVRPASGAAVDSDVNDPLAPYRSNDSVADPQPIPNPVTLGGYANRPGAGPAGRSRTGGDLSDVYRAKLLAGQQINLQIAGDGIQDDLDLGLADLDGNILDAAASQNRVESLTVTTSGDYLLVVGADRGASNYVLTIGQTLAPAEAGMRLSDPFVAGEAIARFRSPIAVRGGLRARLRALGLMRERPEEPTERNALVDLAGLKRVAAYRKLAGATQTHFPGGFQLADPILREKLETLYSIKEMRRDPEVADAGPNYIRRAQFAPNDPLYRFQWHYPQINLPQAWDLTVGADAIVAVIDTGVVLSHPDLQGQWVAGYDFISNPSNAGDGDGIDSNPDDPGDHSHPGGGSSFHGTHIAGTVAAATHNSVGVAGVAFGARVMPLRALGRFGGADYDIEQAVRYAAGLPNDSGTVPPRRADVINLSVGGPGFSTATQAVYDQARAVGVVIVAAAGNDGNGTPFYPAAFPSVLGVGAVDIDKERAPYSNFGAAVDVVAPGGNTARDVNGDGKPDGVLSTVASDSGGALVNDYVIWQGTSMATPHVAGVLALMKSVAPKLTPQDIEKLLASGALTEDLGAPGRDEQFGHGLINAYKAVLAAADGAGRPVDPTPILTVSPAALNFGIGLDSQTLTVLNGGGGDLSVNPPTEDSGGWLSVTPIQVNADGAGSYTVAVQREHLADGVYSATVIFSSNANTVPVNVIMQVANQLSAGSVGQQYVLLVKPESGETVKDVAGQLQPDGGYAFTLSDIPAGAYQLFTGSDANNDLFVCDAGESCGAYLTLDAPVTVEVTQDLSGLDFVSGYTVKLPGVQAAAGRETGMRRGAGKPAGGSR
ncbi:MAG: S8 family serine peptidase [Candidatus Competibacter sp.]|nr:S8 family serine peptidase [Candidatus Competibacter sp.]MDG4584748.1 S8 family serine peptidase [Candidatus Competibacter sp.]